MRIAVPAALDAPGVERLASAIAAVPRGHVLVLHAEESGTFCRGLALGVLTVPPAPVLQDGLRRYADVLLALATGPNPSIAVVTGTAVGGGLGLAAACDVVLASPEARFGLPETSAGLPPFIVWALLARRMHVAAMQRLALDGSAVTAEEASALGLVDRVVPSEMLPRAASAAARQLARVPADTAAIVKAHPPHAAPLRAALDAAVVQTWQRLHDADVVRALADRLEVA